MASLTLSPVQLASAVGALHGFLLTGVLAAQRKNRTANRVLAALMGTFTVYLAATVYYGTGLVRQFPHFFGVSYPTPWLFGPLLYLYALAASDRDWRFAPRDGWHFLPAAAVILVSLPSYLLPGADKLALLERITAGDLSLRMRVLEPTMFVSGIAYTVATALYLRRHARTVEQNYSNTARVNLRWLLAFAAGGGAIWLLATTLLVLDPDGQMRDDHVSLAMALLVYAVGYMGFRQPEVFRYDTQEFPVPPPVAPRALSGVPTGGTPSDAIGAVPAPRGAAHSPVTSARAAAESSTDQAVDRTSEPAADITAGLTADVTAGLTADLTAGLAAESTAGEADGRPAGAGRYERSGLGDDEALRLQASLLQVMERDQPWRESELTLADLAGRLRSTPHKLSEVLNGQVGMTFYDFVNGYRVREVQRRIAAGDTRTRKMLALALDAGFASKSTFNQAFKKHTRQTPSEYRQDPGATATVS